MKSLVQSGQTNIVSSWHSGATTDEHVRGFNSVETIHLLTLGEVFHIKIHAIDWQSLHCGRVAHVNNEHNINKVQTRMFMIDSTHPDPLEQRKQQRVCREMLHKQQQYYNFKKNLLKLEWAS